MVCAIGVVCEEWKVSSVTCERQQAQAGVAHPPFLTHNILLPTLPNTQHPVNTLWPHIGPSTQNNFLWAHEIFISWLLVDTKLNRTLNPPRHMTHGPSTCQSMSGPLDYFHLINPPCPQATLLVGSPTLQSNIRFVEKIDHLLTYVFTYFTYTL